MQRIEYISVDRLHPHPDNPRKDLGDLTELSASIKAKGVLQNLTVVPYYSKVQQRTMNGLYTVIIGHRRLEAAKRAGLTEVPCVIEDMTPAEQVETMMVENVHRSDLTVYEQAEGFQLMLTMGSNVKEVATKTGFSETTIRRRVKLLELDAGKFKKAEGRGGTLQDLLRLNEIKNVDLRNKVLDTIGTPNFNNALKSALDEEEFEEEFAQAVKDLQAADWCKERTTEDISWNGAYTHHRHFYRYYRNPITRPDDTDQAEYVYTIRDKDISIYRKGPNPKKEKSPQEKLQEKYTKKMKHVENQLAAMDEAHKELREEYVREFGAYSSNADAIAVFAAKAFSSGHTTSRLAILGQLAEIPTRIVNGNYQLMDKKKWNDLIRENPSKALLFAAISSLSGYNKYYTSTWGDGLYTGTPEHEKSPALDLIYEGLESLGYEMSEEEIQMQKGTHPLFKEAADLVKAYKKESKEIENEKS